MECGRWKGLQRDERKCKLCNQSAVEDESPFPFECPKYNTALKIELNGIQSC